MKKFLTLVLALVMVLAIAAPAMAFTTKAVPDDVSPYELDVYLVEYDDIGFGTFTALPPSDRGYAKNEIVAVVGELFVPKDEDPAVDGYEFVDFSGENVSFDVNMTAISSATAEDAGADLDPKTKLADGWEYELTGNELAGKATFKWLVFAKVTDDDASITFGLLTAELNWLTAVEGSDPAVSGLDVGDYIVVDGGDEFLVYADAATGDDVLLFSIAVNEDGESEDLFIYDGDTDYAVVETINGFIFVGGGTVLDDEDDDDYEDLMEIFEDDFADEFGFDWDLLGGVVDADWFEDFAGSDDLEVTVDIAPWTAYVTVPDNIVVDPPKTGDAASILGFVMIVLAAAAVVAVRKVRA